MQVIENKKSFLPKERSSVTVQQELFLLEKILDMIIVNDLFLERVRSGYG
jgi:hypothetical protein